MENFSDNGNIAQSKMAKVRLILIFSMNTDRESGAQINFAYKQYMKNFAVLTGG